MKSRVTIKDIAERAGVSRGTVDRVMHGRGKVSPEIKKRILDIIDELGYKKNLLASSLAYNRDLRICCVLPDPVIDTYWREPYNGLLASYESIKHFGFKIGFHFYSQFDVNSFLAGMQSIDMDKTDALVIAPLFYQEAIKYLSDWVKPIIMINTHIPEVECLSYIGQNSYEAGMLGAKLCTLKNVEFSEQLILNLGPKSDNAKHLMDKFNGFQSFLQESTVPDTKLGILEIEDFKDKEKVRYALQSVITERPELKGIFVTNSRAHHLRNAITDEQKRRITIVGFDLLAENIQGLNDGLIDFIINQNPWSQGYQSLISLFEHFVHQKEIDPIQNLPLDIVVKENHSYYLSKKKITEVFV